MKRIGRILKYTVLALIFSIIAFLLVRILIAEYYPREMKSLAPTDNLKAAYALDPDLEIRRQTLAISYDNPDFALFMANHQYYCPAAGELQIALRYPLSLMKTDSKFMYEYYKLAFTGVDFGEATNWIRVDIYYKDAVDYSKEPYACILLYNKELAKDDRIYTPARGELAP